MNQVRSNLSYIPGWRVTEQFKALFILNDTSYRMLS